MAYTDRDTDFYPERDAMREERIRREVRYADAPEEEPGGAAREGSPRGEAFRGEASGWSEAERPERPEWFGGERPEEAIDDRERPDGASYGREMPDRETAGGELPGGEAPGERAEREAAAERAEVRRRARTVRRRKNPLFRFVSGTILVGEQATRYYPYLVTFAVLFFLNIMVLFWSLHLDRRYLRLEREVQKLRERSIRLEEQRYRITTHSAIVREIERRGLGLADPVRPGEIIDD